jgi:hypothetical protein
MTSDLVVYNGLMEHLSQSMVKSQSGIELDTTQISVIDTDQYTSYTFKIKQDSLERQYLLKNFMLTVVNDTTLIQHLIEYPVLGDGSINLEGRVWQRLYGNDLLDVTQPKCGGSTTQWFSYVSCYSIPCIGPPDNRHNYGDSSCGLAGKKGGAQYRCVTQWGRILVKEEPCESIDSGRRRNGGGAASPPVPGAIADTNEIIVAVNPIDPAEPDLCLSDGNGGCVDGFDLTPQDPTQQYINALLSNIRFKGGIEVLKRELSRDFELGFAFISNDTILGNNPNLTAISHRSAANSPDFVDIPFGFTTKVTAHNHYKVRTVVTSQNRNGNSYQVTETVTPTPMFSPDDISTFNENLMQVYNDLANLGMTSQRIQQILYQFSNIVVTDKGNYIIRWNGSVNDLVAINIGDPNSTDRAQRILYKNTSNNYIKVMKKKPENNIVNYLNTLIPRNHYEIYKFDLNGSITRLN